MINGLLRDLYRAWSMVIITCVSSFVGTVIACFVTIPTEEDGTNKPPSKNIKGTEL